MLLHVFYKQRYTEKYILCIQGVKNFISIFFIYYTENNLIHKIKYLTTENNLNNAETLQKHWD